MIKEKTMRLKLFAAALLIGLCAVIGMAPGAAAKAYKYDRSGEYLLSDMVKKSGYDTGLTQKNYMFTHLTKKEQKLYIRLRNGALDLASDIEVPDGMTEESVKRTIRVMMDNEPELFWFTHYRYSDDKIYLVYKNSNQWELEDMQKELTKAASPILKKVKSKSAQQKVYSIHQYLIDLADSNENGSDPQTVYYALVKKENINYCRAGAAAFKYLCDMSGVECMTTCAVYKDNTFEYCMVKADGKWYAVGIWDDIAGYLASNKNAKEGKMRIKYYENVYCMCTSAMIKKTYDRLNCMIIDDKKISLPEAPAADSSDKYWFKANGLSAVGEGSLEEIVQKEYKKIIDKKEDKVIVLIYTEKKIELTYYADYAALFLAAIQKAERRQGYNFKYGMDCYGDGSGGIYDSFLYISYTNN